MRGTIGPTLSDNEVPFSVMRGRDIRWGELSGRHSGTKGVPFSVMRDGDIRGGGTIGSTFSDNKSSFSALRGRDIRGGGCTRVDTQGR